MRHFRNPQLVATYGVGFGVLFNFIAVFTDAKFHLAAPPYDFSPSLLGALFITIWSATPLSTPLTGRAISRFGRRSLMIVVIGTWAAGSLALLLRGAGAADRAGAHLVRGLRHAVPGDLHRRLRDGERAQRAGRRRPASM